MRISLHQAFSCFLLAEGDIKVRRWGKKRAPPADETTPTGLLSSVLAHFCLSHHSHHTQVVRADCSYQICWVFLSFFLSKTPNINISFKSKMLIKPHDPTNLITRQNKTHNKIKPRSESCWQDEAFVPAEPDELCDTEMAVRRGHTHTHHGVGQHSLQRLDSPKDMYIHSVTHTYTHKHRHPCGFKVETVEWDATKIR